MINLFKRIPDNSLWELYGEKVIIYETTWNLVNLYPMVYYYNARNINKKFPFLLNMTRIEFLMNAKKLQ